LIDTAQFLVNQNVDFECSSVFSYPEQMSNLKTFRRSAGAEIGCNEC
jgi:hypothetical protein